jgi:20S proteasome alpha/beta subunit
VLFQTQELTVLRMAQMDNYAAYAAAGPMDGHIREHANWSPYDNNGGTVVAVAGQDYCVVAATTRLSTGYSILSRTCSMMTHLSPVCVLATAGFDGDRATLTKKLQVLSSAGILLLDHCELPEITTICTSQRYLCCRREL